MNYEIIDNIPTIIVAYTRPHFCLNNNNIFCIVKIKIKIKSTLKNTMNIF